MIYSLVVLSSPASGRTSQQAADFARALLARGHSLRRVFFLDTGTVTASTSCVFPQDEADPVSNWSKLAKQQNVELVICVTSALRHGMLDDAEAARHERPGGTIGPHFTISGLGDLVDACASSDRVITFGG